MVGGDSQPSLTLRPPVTRISPPYIRQARMTTSSLTDKPPPKPLIPDATCKADMDNSSISYILSLKPY